MKGSVLPEAWLKRMSAEDLKAIRQMTAEEALEAFTARSERQLQSQIVNLLRLKGIEVCWHRTDKKSAATIGWPDLTFAVIAKVHHGFIESGNRESFKNVFMPCAWEIKFGDGKLSPEQERMRDKLCSSPNYWEYRVIRSVQEALHELREMGVE